MHVWKSNFFDLHKVSWHFFKMRLPIRSGPVDLSGFRSHKISPICFSLHVSFFKLSLVFLIVTFSDLLNIETENGLNSSAFSRSTDVSSLLSFAVGGIKAVFLMHFKYFSVVVIFLSSKTDYSKFCLALLLDCLICSSSLFNLIKLLRESTASSHKSKF